MENKTHPIPGLIYQHYKGGLYEAISVATHTTTKEKLVIYKSHTEGTIYARPLEEWFQKVEIDIDDPNLLDMRGNIARDAYFARVNGKPLEAIRFIPFSMM